MVLTLPTRFLAFAFGATLAAQSLPAALPPAPHPPSSVPQFTVEIPVLVLDHQGQPLLQLDQDRFRLSDNGRPQRISGFDAEAHPVSLALVVDTSDRDAIAQAHRAAELIASMVVGALGSASLYISGPKPRRVLDSTSDHVKIADALRHLAQTPAAPQGQGMITEPASLALLDLAHAPDSDARAVLIIGKDPARSGPAANALVEEAMKNAIAIFRVAPRRPDGTAAAVNPDSTAARGTGAGSQRDPNVLPAPERPGMPIANGNPDSAAVSLLPIPATAMRLAGDALEPHRLDYVYDSGGLTLSGGDNAEFDRDLSSVGADLRSFYRLYFHPDDLAAPSLRHAVSVSVLPAAGQPNAGSISYRRAYLGPSPSH
ncbi:MAG TPA: hypothetical protein VN690_03630 [Terriglobales bacterium]|nr:hypothetical protein [Terriglobales bacterium]